MKKLLFFMIYILGFNLSFSIIGTRKYNFDYEYVNFEPTKIFYKFKDENKLYYNEFSFFEKKDPNFAVINLTKKDLLDISKSKDKKEVYEKIIKNYNESNKNNETEITKYYITSNLLKFKIITENEKFFRYDFSYGFDFQKIMSLDIKKFDKAYEKALNGFNFKFFNTNVDSVDILTKDKKNMKRIISLKDIQIEKNEIFDKKKFFSEKTIMYCITKYSQCERLSDKDVKITDFGDYLEIKVNENEGFYILKRFSEDSILENSKDIIYEYRNYIKYEYKKDDMSYFYWFLKILLEH